MKKILLIATFALVTLVTATAQEPASFQIGEINVEFIGKERTQEKAFLRYLDIYEGQSFATVEELNAALAEQEQDLFNTRYFKSVEISGDETAGDDGVPVYNVNIAVEDGWTFLPIPYPLPNSSIGKNGWSFGLEVNYDNAFGSMMDFYFVGYADIAFGEEEKLKKWKLEPQLNNIKIGDSTLSLSYVQEYSTTKVESTDGGIIQNYTNHMSFISGAIDYNFTSNWFYNFGPQISMKYGYDYHNNQFEGTPVTHNDTVIEDSLNFVYNHSFGARDVDWIGPLRKGYDVKLENNLELRKSQVNVAGAPEEYRFVSDLEMIGVWYQPIGKRLNYYTRGNALVVLNDNQDNLGDKLRGVKNETMAGNLGFFWQNTLGIEVAGNDSVHFQLHPWLDTGFAYSKDIDNQEFADVFRFGFGSDVILMLGSIDLRAKVGYDPIYGYLDFSFDTGLTY